MKEENIKPISKDYELWNNFKQWLVKQEIIIIPDFNKCTKQLWTISDDTNKIAINIDEVIYQFERT